MSEEVANENSGGRGNRKHRLGRRIRLIVGALTLVAVSAALGAGATAHAGRMGGWHGFATTENLPRPRSRYGSGQPTRSPGCSGESTLPRSRRPASTTSSVRWWAISTPCTGSTGISAVS